MQKTIGTEVLLKGYIQNPTVDHFIDHIQVKLSWSTPTILGGLSRPWSPDQGYEYCLLRSNSSSKSPKGDQDPWLNHLMNISSSVGHLARWTSQKWQPLRCPQKPQRSPASRTSGCATWWRNAWCLTTGPVHVTMTMPNILHERVRNVRNVCECTSKTIFMQKCPEDVDFAIQRWAPSSSIHEKDTIWHHADAERSTTKSSCKFYLIKKIQNTHQLESLMRFVHNWRISTLKRWIHSINAHSNQISNPPKVFER